MKFRGSVRTVWTPIWATVAFAVVATAVLLAPSPALAQIESNAQAQQSRSLHERFFGRNLPSVGRYVAENGQGFILDRTGTTSLLRFDRSVETWALRSTAAPRGDMLYRNDAGQLVLRVTADGGMTLYTPRTPQGSPVSMVGPGESLEPPALGPMQLFNLMQRRSGMLSEALGRLIQINLPDVNSEALSVDALIVTTDAVMRMARSVTARGRLDRLRSITIIEGGRAGVNYTRGELRVTIDPSRGAAGRPSSARIIEALSAESR
jgi:Domain of unknown function (DUF4908)